jgi:hypothetical protein
MVANLHVVCATYFNICMKMLNYVKTVLARVSFDARLFEKELRKAIKVLIAEELQELRRWCYANYEVQYGPVLNRCFAVA